MNEAKLREQLFKSVVRNDAAALSQALSDGAQLDWRDEHGLTVLYQCVWLQRCELITLLLESHGAKVEETAGKLGADCTALESAVAMNAGAVVEVLLAHGANIHAINMYGYSVVDIAADYHRVEMMTLLLGHGASVDTYAETQPIVQAVKKRSIAMFSLLLKHGASLETTDRNGLPLLHLAIRVGAYDIWSWLIDQRLLLDATDLEGNTPLHAAAEVNALAAATRLLRVNIPTDTHNKQQRTPLHVAALHNASAVVKLLQDHEASQHTPSTSETAAAASHIASSNRIGATSASSAASLQVVRPSRVITYATMRILTAKSLRSVLILGTQSPFCSWTLRHTTTVLARGQTSRHRQGGKQANWTSESFPLSIADLKSKDRHSVSLMECSLKFEVRTPTAVPGTTKSIGMATFAMNLLSTQSPAGTRTGHSVSLFHKGIVAGELLVELLY